MISVTDLINSESPVGFAKYDIRRFTPRLKCDGKADGLRCLIFCESTEKAGLLCASREFRVWYSNVIC